MIPPFSCSDATRALIRRANQLDAVRRDLSRSSMDDAYRAQRAYREWRMAWDEARRALCAEAGLRS